MEKSCGVPSEENTPSGHLYLAYFKKTKPKKQQKNNNKKQTNKKSNPPSQATVIYYSVILYVQNLTVGRSRFKTVI